MDMSSAVSNSLNTELIWQEVSMLVSKPLENKLLAAGALLMRWFAGEFMEWKVLHDDWCGEDMESGRSRGESVVCWNCESVCLGVWLSVGCGCWWGVGWWRAGSVSWIGCVLNDRSGNGGGYWETIVACEWKTETQNVIYFLKYSILYEIKLTFSVWLSVASNGQIVTSKVTRNQRWYFRGDNNNFHAKLLSDDSTAISFARVVGGFIAVVKKRKRFRKANPQEGWSSATAKQPA